VTGSEFRVALKALGIRQKWLAERLGVSTSTVFRWTKGDLAVPEYAAFVLYLLNQCPHVLPKRGRRAA
jgi:DNA-binding transcriptional regulator YiaG